MICALCEICVSEICGSICEICGYSNARVHSIGWRARVFLKEGIGLTYPWIEGQVIAARAGCAGKAAKSAGG